MKKDSSGKPGTWKRILLTGLCVFLAILLVISLGLTIAMEYFMHKLDSMENLNTETLSQQQIDQILSETDPVSPDFTGPVLEHEDITTGGQPAQEISGENIIQILLIGQDARPGEGRQRSDAMILCTINKSKKTLTLTSFMRDMYVQIPGYGGNKLNAAYQFGGMPLLDQCLYESFGIQVDGNIEVDFDGFMEVVDILGGVDVELTATEASYLNRHREEGDWYLREGVNHLDGEQALAYSRLRKINAEADGTGEKSYADYGRTNRQRRVLMAMFEKVASMGLDDVDKVIPLVNKLTEHVATDMDSTQILRYVQELLPIFSQLQVDNLRIPIEGGYYSAYVGSKDVLVPDLEANRKALLEKLT